MAHPQFTAKTLHCIECPLRPLTCHLVAQNAAGCSNVGNVEVSLGIITTTE